MRLKDAPSDIQALARFLGYDDQALGGLRRAHGPRLLKRLQREWWERQDRPRWLHQNSSHGYTQSPIRSLCGESQAEAVPEEYQQRISVEARKVYLMQSRSAARERREKLRQAEARAMKRKIDISPHLAAIEARIRMIEAELDQAA